MVSQNAEVTASDINTILNKIQGEASLRGASDTTSDVAQNNEVQSANPFKTAVATNIAINADHCYCEADGGIEQHDGGTTLTLTASSGDFDVGDEILAVAINKIDTDINSLIAQVLTVQSTYGCSCDYVCDCDDDCTCVGNCTCYSSNCTCVSANCTCVSQSCSCDGQKICTCQGGGGCGCNPYCTCNYVCTCNYDCGNNCSCNTNYSTCGNECDCNTYPSCTCNTVCTCNTYNITCCVKIDCDPCTCYSDCYCESGHCTCVSGHCTCVSGNCSCNTDCSCVSECSCNQVCSCEFN